MPFEYIVAILIALIPILYAAIQAFLDANKVDAKKEIEVVCSSCVPDLIAAKTLGIQDAMRRLFNLIGDDELPLNLQVWPITFHLDGDGICGQYQSGMTGFFKLDTDGLGHVCLFDMEKENRSLPFTVENAEKIEDQLLPVHEAMHGWFVGRQETYRIQEPFCKLISFIISQFPGGPEYCNWFSSIPDNHPDILMKYLCEIGMTSQLAVQILRQVAKSAGDSGRALSDVEFADVVTSVLGTDAVPAFRSAGILP
jgi:hypothetical protein